MNEKSNFEISCVCATTPANKLRLCQISYKLGLQILNHKLEY
nr:MAG TPA: hypothetical protein [Caudoviricetes sp.]